MEAPVIGEISTPAGAIKQVATKWSAADYVGAWRMRLDIGRLKYAVAPGLYAIGSPDANSTILVSANYKLSFDVLRRELEGLNVWILVLDTKGINVWCAAGKGTFGTMEIVRRIGATELEKIVTNRTLIVPQLGATGVAGHMVQAFTGFAVKFGPVRARDIKAYLAAGMKATPEMRRVTFTMYERLEVSWMELAHAIKPSLLITTLLIACGLLGYKPAWLFITLLWSGIIAGSLLTAALLPYVPVRAFSGKGGIVGALVAVFIVIVEPHGLTLPLVFSSILFPAAVSAYVALNYTGNSTFTSLSGVKKEIKFALPIIIGMIVLSVLLQLAPLIGRFL